MARPKTRRTPGRWRVSGDMRGLMNAKVAGVEDAQGFAVANCGIGGNANAKFIARAPEMYDAIVDLTHRIQQIVDTWSHGDLAGAVNLAEESMHSAYRVLEDAGEPVKGHESAVLQ